MKKTLLTLILSFLFLFPFFSSSQNYQQTKNYISIGFLDHKTGNSAIGYTRSFLQNKNNELFVGFGTMIAINTFVIGYKKYWLRSFIDGYSAITLQKIYGMGGELNAVGLSFGFEKKIWKLLFINIGINSTIELSTLKSVDFLTLPSLGLSLRY